MADYYVSTARGSDSTGTGSATNPWKTIGKAIGASPAITLPGSGTTKLYIEPGTYYEIVTLALAPTSAAPLELIGDCDGSGFAAGGYASAVSGVVDWCGWSDESTVITGTTLSGDTASYVTLRRLKITGGQTGSSASCVHITTGTNWTVAECVLIAHVSGQACLHVTGATAGLNLTVDRCDMYLSSGVGPAGVRIAAAETASEYSLNSTIRNCRIWGGGGGSHRGVRLDRASSTGLGKLGTGLSVLSCTITGCSALLIYNGVTINLTTPLTVQGCLLDRCTDGINAGHSSHVAEDYNLFHATSPRTNTPTGSNSTTVLRPALEREDRRAFGLSIKRPYAAPAGALTASAGYSAPAVDRFGRARNNPTAYGAIENLDDAAAASNAFDPLGALIA